MSIRNTGFTSEPPTPILLTNTLAVWDAASALADHVLTMPGNESVRSINPVVGETNDGWLNDIRRGSLRREHFLAALRDAKPGEVAGGAVGAVTGTRAFGYKGGHRHRLADRGLGRSIPSRGRARRATSAVA